MTDLKNLKERIAAATNKEKEPENTGPSSNISEGLNTGMRILTELIGTILVSGFIGYLLDRWLDTAPLFFLILLLLGIITMFYNMMKFLRGGGQKVGLKGLQNDEKVATPLTNKNNDNNEEQ